MKPASQSPETGGVGGVRKDKMRERGNENIRETEENKERKR